MRAMEGLTTRLLLGTPADDGGLEQVLAGQRPLADCIHPSPLHDAVAVLGSGPGATPAGDGRGPLEGGVCVARDGKSSFDVVLIDSPALLQVADATEMVGASDAAIIVVGPDELIRDHLEMVDRLKHHRVRCRRLHLRRSAYAAPRARYQRNGSSARLTDLDPPTSSANGSSARPTDPDPSTGDFPTLSFGRPNDDGNIRPLNEAWVKGAVSSYLLSREPCVDVLVDAPGRAGGASGRLLVLYGRLLGPLLGGYLLLDRAFAYVHLPGTPLYVGEMVLTVGILGVLSATGYLRIPVRDEPVLALLAALFLWGLIRLPPGLRTYGITALRDFALCYYCFFAFFTVAALARAPDLLDRWLAQLARFAPWLLVWLPFGLVMPLRLHGPSLPFSGGVPILTHKPGNAAIAALIALGFMWLFPETRSARSRALWSIMALLAMALSATQNRGGLLGATAGAVVGLAFLPSRHRLRLIVQGIAVIVIGLILAVQLSLQHSDRPKPGPGVHGVAVHQQRAEHQSAGSQQRHWYGGRP